MKKTAFIFPGQGAQYIGMACDFAESFKESRLVFEEAGETLGTDIFRLIREGSEADLQQTEVTQPAVLTACIATLAAMRVRGFECCCAAGLSLGEYAALVAAGSIDFPKALQAVRERAKIMQNAVPEGEGTMISVIGVGFQQISDFINENFNNKFVGIANYNSPEQIVLSGETKATEAAAEAITKHWHSKTVKLPVSAPFHSQLLFKASEKFAPVVENLGIKMPGFDVYSNVTAEIYRSTEEIKTNLVRQFYSTVLWAPTAEKMVKSGITDFYELGPGHSLSAFVKRVANSLLVKVSTQNIECISALDSLSLSR